MNLSVNSEINFKTLKKINLLPENLLSEVNDFIDFLLKKNNLQFDSENNNLTESDMNYYLKNLENYENLLQDGKIKW